MRSDSTDQAIIIRKTIISELRQDADPARSRQQQAYMKSSMPYLGVTVPKCRRIARSVFKSNPLPDALAWERAILELWRGATYREERYSAIDLLHYRAYSTWLDPARFPLIEELVVTGSWWDYVDGIASNAVGTMLVTYPDEVKAVVLEWAVDDNIWKRRTSILCQLRAKGATDAGLLKDAMRPSIGSSELFLRKAIGWALREYSKTNPNWVRSYVNSHPGLSNLSRREALKHLQRAGRNTVGPAHD